MLEGYGGEEAFMKEWVRHCINPLCSQELRACNGFVIARDIVEYFEGKRSPQHVREICARCSSLLSTKPSREDRSYEEFIEALESLLGPNPIPLPHELREAA